jgi:hypothetical protein
LTASRAARNATAGAANEALVSADPSAVVSTASRTERVIHSAIGAASRPVLRAAFTRLIVVLHRTRRLLVRQRTGRS